MKFQLKIETLTWDKENYDLFDYEALNLQKNQFETEKEGQLQRRDLQTAYCDHPSEQEENLYSQFGIQKLLGIEKRNGDLHINPLGCQSLWLVNRQVQQGEDLEWNKLKEGDCIKLGKKQFLIRQIKDNFDLNGVENHYTGYFTNSDLKKISNIADTFISQQQQEDLDQEKLVEDYEEDSDLELEDDQYQYYQQQQKEDQFLQEKEQLENKGNSSNDHIEQLNTSNYQNSESNSGSDNSMKKRKKNLQEKQKQFSQEKKSEESQNECKNQEDILNNNNSKKDFEAENLKNNPSCHKQQILESERESQPCRICLRLSTCKKNPLISPCNCKGSIRRVHADCLQRWINWKLLLKQSENVIEFNSNSVKCEICKSFYPPQIHINGQDINLYEFAANFTKFVILEDKEGPLFILNFTNKMELSIGRGHNSDLKIGEITVSRNHAALLLKNGQLYLADKKSKFGTLIHIPQPISIPINKEIQLQSGRTLIQIKRKPVKGFFENWFGICCQNHEQQYYNQPKRQNQFSYQQNPHHFFPPSHKQIQNSYQQL